jgi:putative DNA primase/helicase
MTKRDLFPSADVDGTSQKRKNPGVPSTPRRNSKTFPLAAEAVAKLEKRLGKRSAWWTYADASGDPVAVVVRWDNADGKTFRPVAKIDGRWRIGDPAGIWPLYRLPELLQSSGRVYVVEGEKAADALRALGFTVTTSAHGASSARGTDWTPLAGRDVVILPDNDAAGAGYAEAVIDLLSRLTPKPVIKIVNLPGLPVGGDVVDFIADRKGGGHG